MHSSSVLTEDPQSQVLGRPNNPCFPACQNLIDYNNWLSRQPRSLPYPERYSMKTPVTKGRFLCRMHFSVPFFEILPSNISRKFHARTFHPGAEDKDGDHWRFGKLYGDKNGRLLRYGAFNVRVAQCHFLERYWLGSDPFHDRQLLRVQ